MGEDYEIKRLENIERKTALLKELGIQQQTQKLKAPVPDDEHPTKRRKVESSRKESKLSVPPARSSARIASAPSQPRYHEDAIARDVTTNATPRASGRGTSRRQKPTSKSLKNPQETQISIPHRDHSTLLNSWTSWTPSAPIPTRSPTSGTFHFPTHSTFTPNLSPSEILTQGSFGGTYFRPLYSRTLDLTVSNDHLELPAPWISGLDISRYLTSPTYDPDVNRFKVRCGQTIEQWEANGWINHTYDVRGWFQWYSRFFRGRRCEDDDRQVSRWERCVGINGRWRRMLLKRYVQMGVREVFDDGEDDDDGEEDGGKGVSPVIHQTCWHWGVQISQGMLDETWRVEG